MLNVVFIFALALSSNAAIAGWTEKASDKIAHEYVNLQTIEHNENIVKMWNMSDFKEPQAVGNGQLFQSTKAHQEYNCISNTKRLLSIIHYADGMGTGKVVFFNASAGDWRKVLSGSLGQIHLDVACESLR